MQEKLTWEEIRSTYKDEWVELVNFEWNESEANPSCGVVYRHSKERKELHTLFMRDPIDNSAIVFTGTIKFPEGSIFSANLHQYVGREK